MTIIINYFLNASLTILFHATLFSTLDLNRIYKFIVYTLALNYTLSFMALYSLKQYLQFYFGNKNIFMLYKSLLYSAFYLISKLIEGRYFVLYFFCISIIFSIEWSHNGYLINKEFIQSSIHSYASVCTDLRSFQFNKLQVTHIFLEIIILKFAKINKCYLPQVNLQKKSGTNPLSELYEVRSLVILSLCTPPSSTMPGKYAQ